VTAFPKIVTPNAPFAMVAERRLEPLPASTGMAAICAFLSSTASSSVGSKFPPNGRIKGLAVIGPIHTSQRCNSANRRALDDDKAPPLHWRRSPI
jgi:hypothetical protein